MSLCRYATTACSSSGSQPERRHFVAGLLRLRVGNPAVEIGPVHRQRSGGDRSPAREMREVRADLAIRRRAGDVVAAAAFVSCEISVARQLHRGSRREGGAPLPGDPTQEIVLAFDRHDQSHVRMLDSAEFGALPAVEPDLVGSSGRRSSVPGSDPACPRGSAPRSCG